MTMTHTGVVNDRMQREYAYWPTELVGRHFAPAFTPDLTPKEMLRHGVWREVPDRLPGRVSPEPVRRREVVRPRTMGA